EGGGVRDYLASGECGEDRLYVRDAHLATGGEGDRDLSLPAQARLFGGEPNPEAPQGERAGVPDVELGVCALGHGEGGRLERGLYRGGLQERRPGLLDGLPEGADEAHQPE